MYDIWLFQHIDTPNILPILMLNHLRQKRFLRAFPTKIRKIISNEKVREKYNQSCSHREVTLPFPIKQGKIR